MSEPILTVLLPVHNGGTFLAEAMKSLLGQTFTDFKLLAIDDGSTDSTAAILADFAQKDKRVHVVANQQCQGLIKTLNLGLEMAKGAWIARMDGDDICKPERFAAQLSWLEKHPGYGVCGTAARKINAAGEDLGLLAHPCSHHVLIWEQMFCSPIIHPSAMFSLDLVRQVGCYKAEYRHFEDYDLWQRLAGVTMMGNLPEALLFYRQHEKSICAQHQAEQMMGQVLLMSRGMERCLGYAPAREAVADILRLRQSVVQPDAGRRAKAAALLCELHSIFCRSHKLDMDDARQINILVERMLCEQVFLNFSSRPGRSWLEATSCLLHCPHERRRLIWRLRHETPLKNEAVRQILAQLESGEKPSCRGEA